MSWAETHHLSSAFHPESPQLFDSLAHFSCSLLPPFRRCVRQVSAGVTHTVLCCTDGAAYACGDSADGRCGFAGRGRWQRAMHPIVLSGDGSSGVAKVAAGFRHTLALTYSGTVWAFGYGRGGRLGHGLPATSMYSPRRVMQFPACVVDIAAGTMHSAFARKRMVDARDAKEWSECVGGTRVGARQTGERANQNFRGRAWG